MATFIGRADELNELKKYLTKNSASLIVVNGRRRIGKSRLIEEFGKNQKMFSFAGLPPTTHTTAESQRIEFVKQMARQGIPGVDSSDWSDIFWHLGQRVKKERVVILLDEISWLGSKDPDFLGKLKNAWDLYLKQNPKLILILCGSVSAWIEKNILGNTGFIGRITLTLTLQELPLKDCLEFWANKQHISISDILILLSVTGGIPRYLEEMNPHLSAQENIKQLCFVKSGLLFYEFENIFSDLFSKRSSIYKAIVTTLVEGPADQDKICAKIKLKKNRSTSEYFDDLQKAGFIARDYTWHVENGIFSKLSKYRLSDNYIRFYLKYIQPNKIKITQGDFINKSLSSLPGWDTIISLQIENLLLNNRKLIQKALNLSPDEILANNPFFQRKTLRSQGCQIDYLIQSKSNCLYVCEIKFSKYKIKVSVIDEVKQKIERLQKPKNISVHPVLIHVNGVEDEVIDREYFSKVIDFSEFLK